MSLQFTTTTSFVTSFINKSSNAQIRKKQTIKPDVTGTS